IDVHGIDVDVAERSARCVGTGKLRERRSGDRERGKNEQKSCFHGRTLYQGRGRQDTARREQRCQRNVRSTSCVTSRSTGPSRSHASSGSALACKASCPTQSQPSHSSWIA